jgi:hypothetical protein
MAQEYRIDTVLISNRVRLNNDAKQGVVGLPSAAWYGEPAVAGIRIDDPLGELDLRGWHTFTHDETSCTGNERTFSGWIIGKTIDRGPFRYGAARVWECEVHDLNTAFSLEVFRASSAKRPEETDIERVAWAQASAPMAGTPLADNGRFNTTDNPVGFGPSDYVTQFPQGLFESVAGTSGKNFYAYFDQTANEPSLHYDLVGVGPTSTLSISNVESDASSTCFYPFIDAQLSRSAADQVTGVLFGFLGGQYVYGRNLALIDALSPTEFSPVNFLRDAVYTTDRVGKAATANNLLAAQLAARAVEVDTITCSIRVPAAQVNLLMAGDLVDVKFTHLPAYEDFVTVPVIRRNVIPSDGRRDMYDLHLTLSNEIQAVGPGGGDPGDSPYEPVTCDPDNINTVQALTQTLTNGGGFGGDGYVTLDDTPTDGNLLFLVTMWFEPEGNGQSIVAVNGYTAITPVLTESDRGMCSQAWYRNADGSETNHVTFDADSGGFGDRAAVAFMELSGVADLDDWDADGHTGQAGSTFNLPLGTVTPTSGSTGALIGFAIPGLDQNDPWITHTPNPPFAEDTGYYTTGASRIFVQLGHDVITNASGSYSRSITSSHNNISGWMSGLFAFTCTGEDVAPPGALQIVRGEVVDMGGDDTGTTRFPFAPGSLEVFVDNTDQTPAIIATDPDAGTFQLAFTPTPTELVVVNYLAGVGGPGV